MTGVALPGQGPGRPTRWGALHSHVRACLLGPSLALPILGGDLPLGTWQQVVLLDFDTRARSRTVVVTLVGE